VPKASGITFAIEKKLDFILTQKVKLKKWIADIARNHSKSCGKLSFFFCSDKYLHSVNLRFLKENTLTDIITFDYTSGKTLSGEIFISIERVKENAIRYNESFHDELLRTVIHGILHLCGFEDKRPSDKKLMRERENEAISAFKKYYD
jgi:probable rRNA maturation factor